MESAASDHDKIKHKLSDRAWRLNNLYYIKDKAGHKVLMRLNWAQSNLFENIWYYNVILKARQLGFTTFVMAYFLDACLFNSNHSAGVIAHTKSDAEDLFKNKIKFAYDSLPQWLRDMRPATQDSAKSLVFNNDSSINVGTSLRSGTYQKLLVSEYGKVSAKFPEKAKEIKTGALNTVDAGQQIFIESTAEGKTGEFFNMCEQGRKLKDQRRELTQMQPRFHFYAWFRNPAYRLSDDQAALTPIPQEIAHYLAGLPIDSNQAAWYAAKFAVMGTDMKREYPSTPQEAFEGSLEGAYYTQQMASLRRQDRITRIVKNPSYPVYTSWDLGLNDMMSVWFFQYIHGELYFIDYHESSNEGWEFYVKMLKEKDHNYQTHYWPHDGNNRVRGAEVFTDKKLAGQLGIRPIEVIPVTKSVALDIRNYCKPTLPLCFFDEEACAIGITHLDNYRKAWDKVGGMYKDSPLHDDSSHGSDGFRTAAVALKTGKLDPRQTLGMQNKAQGLQSISRFKGNKNKGLRNSR